MKTLAMKSLVRGVVLAVVATSLTLVGNAGAAPSSCTGTPDPFTDVAAGSFARDDITCLFNLGVTTGTSPTTYDPAGEVTREQMAAFLSRLYTVLNGSAAPIVATPFTDVSATSFAKDSIARIFGLGITTGTSATTYSPADSVTREQMAAFLSRLYTVLNGSAAPVVVTPFTDVSATSFAKDAIARIFGLGITTGTSPTTYSPSDFVTREQMAAFLSRLYEILEPDPDPDPGVNHDPELAAQSTRTNDEGDAVSVTITATDADNDPLTFGATNLPPGLVIAPSTGVISGAVSAGAATGSPYTVTVSVDDGEGGDDSAAFTWVIEALGGGPFGFAAPVSYPMPGDDYVGKDPINGLLDPAHGVELADLNNDGKIDLAAAISEPAHAMVVRLGNGDGTFGAPDAYSTRSSTIYGSHPKSVRALLVNGDAIPDLVTANQETNNSEDVTVFLGNGDGTFQSGIFVDAGCPGAHDANGGYLNNDAFLDLVVACTDVAPTADSVTVLYGNGNGTFQTAIGYRPVTNSMWPGSLAVDVGDVDEDGKVDVIVANFGQSSVGYLRNTGSGALAPAVEIAVGNNPHDAILIDVDGDANLDVVAVNEGGNTVSVRHGDGNGNFAAGLTLSLPPGSFPKGAAVADLDGDGRRDIVVGNSHDNYPAGTTPTTVSIFIQKANGTFESALTLSADLTPFAVDIADLDGDTKPDIAVAMWNSEDVKILLQN